MKSILSDQELLASFCSGNNKAMDSLVNRYYKSVLAYIKHLTRNQELSEDLCQETFVKAINSLKRDGYHDDGKFISWLMRIAHNLVIDHFRKQIKISTVSNDACEGDLFNNARYSDDNVETCMQKFQINKDLKSLISELPSEQRETVIMRLSLDMSFKEIAEAQNISINTALGRMRYAVINLRKMISERNLTMQLS